TRPITALAPAVTRAASITLRVSGPVDAKRLEFATTTTSRPRVRPTATPTGAGPTGTDAKGVCVESDASRSVANASRSSLPRAGTNATSPPRDTASRTGLQPAGTRATTAFDGSRVARCTSITITAPAGSVGAAGGGVTPSGKHTALQPHSFRAT